jgi:hypothetical protein
MLTGVTRPLHAPHALAALVMPDSACAVGSVLVGDEVEHFQRGLLVREVSAMPDGSPEAGVERLDGVGRVDDLAELGGELEERDELVPRRLPRPGESSRPWARTTQ